MQACWVTRAIRLIESDTPAMLLRVVGTQGSVPRDIGTRMIITADNQFGTIGGGNLEYRAIATARGRLSECLPEGELACQLHRYPLGATLGQCCGGLVQLLYEPLSPQSLPALYFLNDHLQSARAVVMLTRAQTPTEDGDTYIQQCFISEHDWYGERSGFDASTVEQAQALLTGAPTSGIHLPLLQWVDVLEPNDFQILLFGAGHVGRALVTVLSTLPCELRWIDSRPDAFPKAMPDNVQQCLSEEPEEEIDKAPGGSYALVMTHNHALDERICAAALCNQAIAWCGLIGSTSKCRRFQRQLQARGISEEAISRLCCPIGDATLGGKLPGEIAVTTAAQILALRQQQVATGDTVVSSRSTPLPRLNL